VKLVGTNLTATFNSVAMLFDNGFLGTFIPTLARFFYFIRGLPRIASRREVQRLIGINAFSGFRV
jgi:hypothetical protein